MNQKWGQARKMLEAAGAKVVRGSDKYDAWLREKKVADELRVGLINCCLQQMTGVNAIRLYSEKDIISCNSPGGIPVALKRNLLIVGTCPNGDPVVIDVAITKGDIGYLCAETMWQEDDVRSAFVPVAPSFASFLEGLSTDKLPLDYFEAKERAKK